ncbi:hypothetical protein [Parashewanella curva]|uniref:hypothetical protein n=1 Tax=Parashewanella curva TaxID=2338552 RepID=UPI00105A1983|nr:hypothetical protein [Parashewanella curva]
MRCVVIEEPEASHFALLPDAITAEDTLLIGLRHHEDGRITVNDHVDHPMFHNESLRSLILEQGKGTKITQLSLPQP